MNILTEPLAALMEALFFQFRWMERVCALHRRPNHRRYPAGSNWMTPKLRRKLLRRIAARAKSRVLSKHDLKRLIE